MGQGGEGVGCDDRLNARAPDHTTHTARPIGAGAHYAAFRLSVPCAGAMRRTPEPAATALSAPPLTFLLCIP